jgi:hypothetical protein
MKCLTIEEAKAYLSHIGINIGNWNQMTEIASDQSSACWINYQAPKNSQELLNFAQLVAGWLPKGDWKIFQIDNSGVLDAAQADFFGRLLFGSEKVPSFIDKRTFLFEFGNDSNANKNTELLIANLIYLFLLFESHGYVVSSNRDAVNILQSKTASFIFIQMKKRLSTSSFY